MNVLELYILLQRTILRQHTWHHTLTLTLNLTLTVFQASTVPTPNHTRVTLLQVTITWLSQNSAITISRDLRRAVHQIVGILYADKKKRDTLKYIANVILWYCNASQLCRHVNCWLEKIYSQNVHYFANDFSLLYYQIVILLLYYQIVILLLYYCYIIIILLLYYCYIIVILSNCTWCTFSKNARPQQHKL